MNYGISAAALIVQNNEVLLVHHREAGQYDFWVPPGGRLEGEESIMDCAKREALEEAGFIVEPGSLLYYQEFVEPGYHFCKFFILSKIVGGNLTLKNRGKEEDFLVEAHFFSQNRLADLDVRPDILKQQFWRDLTEKAPPTRYLGLIRVKA